MSDGVEISILDAGSAKAVLSDLAGVLADCVAGGASVNFMFPFGADDAAAFFETVLASVARGETVLFAARHRGRVVGTVQLGLDTPPNQPHRGEIKKMLVHRSARERGVGAALLAAAESEAKRRDRTLLILDTASDAAERLYARGGWQRLGTVPDYALLPGGGYCDSTFFWKQL